MAFFDRGRSTEGMRDASEFSSEFDHYAHLEDLVGEETRLVEEVDESRKHEHRERLHEISEELERVWETLRARAERLGRHQDSSAP